MIAIDRPYPDLFDAIYRDVAAAETPPHTQTRAAVAGPGSLFGKAVNDE